MTTAPPNLGKPHKYDADPYSNAKPPLCRCGMAQEWWQHQRLPVRRWLRLTGRRWAK